MPAKYALITAKNGKTNFRLLAPNGQVILASQGYASRAGARRGIASVQKHCSADDSYERKKARNGKDFFVLKARNRQVIGKSEMYNAARPWRPGSHPSRRTAPPPPSTASRAGREATPPAATAGGVAYSPRDPAPVPVWAARSAVEDTGAGVAVMEEQEEMSVDLKEHLQQIERDLIEHALQRSKGVVAEAARMLNVGRTTLVEKIRKYDLDTDASKSAVA